jgi:glycosyltransferase involved in cell wall biosynthesis
MKILQLIYESVGSPFGFGGAGVRACEIYRRLQGRHDITLLCMKYPGAKDGYIENIRHTFVGTESRSLPKSVFAYTIMAAKFVKQYGKDFDIIVENFLPATPFFSCLFTKTPVILQVQGIMEKHVLRKLNPVFSVPMYLVELQYPKLFKRFMFVSEITKAKVMSGVRRKVELCEVIPNGISDVLLEATPDDGDYILFFSRIDRYTKGLDILLHVFERLAPEYPGLKLELAGYEADKVSDLLSRCPEQVRSRISYAGFVSGEKKIDLLSGARLFVLPSRHESAPVSIIEAAACGKPVIVSDIPELKFVEEQGFGLCFPSNSVKGLQEKVELLLKNDEMRHQLGRKGREYAQKYLWDTLALQYENVLYAACR